MNLKIVESRLRTEYQLPAGFVFWKWECFPKASREMLYVEFAGGECPLLKTGKRKGKPNYRKATGVRLFHVTPDKAAVWEREYEEQTGNCRECVGDGKQVARISVADGTEYRPCWKCQGSGKATSAVPVA